MSGEHIENVNFCNVKKNRIKIKDACKNLDSSKAMLNKIFDDISKRFEEELILSIDELRQTILDEYQFRNENLSHLKKLKLHSNLKR